jgi:hypothetical protein
VTGANTYLEEVSYPISIAINHHGIIASAASSAQVADAPLSASGMTISSTEGAAFNGAVATFSDADPNGVASDYAATIIWGDGQTSAGVISGSQATGFTVTGANTYADEGSYPLSVAISDHGATATAAGTTQVADAPWRPALSRRPRQLKARRSSGPCSISPTPTLAPDSPTTPLRSVWAMAIPWFCLASRA